MELPRSDRDFECRPFNRLGTSPGIANSLPCRSLTASKPTAPIFRASFRGNTGAILLLHYYAILFYLLQEKSACRKHRMRYPVLPDGKEHAYAGLHPR